MADRLIAWLEDCGYEIVKKAKAANDDSAVMVEEQPLTQQLAQVC
jgi:hypothetical protein